MDGRARLDSSNRGRVHDTLVTALLAAWCVLGVPTTVWAQPDFSESSIRIEPATVTEGDVVTIVVTLRNSGSEDAPYAEMDFGLPLEALFVEYTGLEEATLDLAEKTLTATVNLPAGSDRRFQVRMVVPRDAGGHSLVPYLTLRYSYRQVEFRDGAPIPIDTAVSTRGLPLVGGIRLAPAGLVVLAVAALYPTLWVALPRRRRRPGPMVMIVLATGFLTMFGALAKRDWETLTAWTAAPCTILDKRVRIETSASRVGRQRTRQSETRSLRPLLALKYSVDGHDVISSGYETGTRLSIGRGEALASEYAQWQVGATVPCWFNPDEPREVIVRRGFGGAYAFAVIPLAVLGLGVAGLQRRWR
jgi:hypothetical protein